VQHSALQTLENFQNIFSQTKPANIEKYSFLQTAGGKQLVSNVEHKYVGYKKMQDRSRSVHDVGGNL
jgi:hypothetical protein